MFFQPHSCNAKGVFHPQSSCLLFLSADRVVILWKPLLQPNSTCPHLREQLPLSHFKAVWEINPHLLMLWKTVDSVYLLEFGLKVSVLWITSERGIDFPSPAVIWQLQRPSDSATSSRDSRDMRFALGCILFKKKGKEKKSFRLGYFKAVWGRESISSLASYLGMLPTCCLGCRMSAGRGWSQRLFWSGKSWSHSCSWWRTFNPPSGWQLALGKCFREQYFGWNFSNHITPSYKALWHAYRRSL